MPILVTKDGQQYGPYELAELQGYVTQGSFSLTDLCWQDGWADWMPLSTIISRPPPPPSSIPVSPTPAAAQQNITGDQIIWQGRATLWKYAGPIIWSVVISTLLAIFTMGIGAVLAPIWWLGIYLAYRSRKYVLTRKRVIVESGIFIKSSNEIRIKDVRSINVSKRGIAGLFGIGTVDFFSAASGDAEVSFQSIPQAKDIKDMVNELQE